MGSLDVEIDALAERIDMAERQPRQPRQSDEERLAMALEQSRLEHSQVEQRRLDWPRAPALVRTNHRPIPSRRLAPPAARMLTRCSAIAAAQSHRGTKRRSRTSSVCRPTLASAWARSTVEI